MDRSKFYNIKKIRTVLSKVFAVVTILVFVFSFNKTESYFNNVTRDIIDIIGLLLCTIGAFGRIWCGYFISGFKNKKVVKEGPYSMCRNPLYYFSFIGMLGIVLITHSLLIMSVMLIAFFGYYPFVIIGEESKLEKIIGKDYINYKREVPRFLPKFSLCKMPKLYEGKPKVFAKDLRDCTMFFVTYGAIIILNSLKMHDIIPTFFNIF